jgi:Fic family protein
MTYGGAANLLGVTQRAARLNVEKLVESGILKEASGRRRNRIFAATEIIAILEARETID